MFELGFNQFLHNNRRNLLSIIQVILVYIIAIFMVSSCVEQLSLWNGVKDYIDKTGIVLWSRNFDNDVDINNILTKVEKVNKKYSYDFSVDANHYYLVSTHPGDNCYKVPLKEGRWCESGSAENGAIRAVVSDAFRPDCDVGDIIKIGAITLKITGVYNHSELVYKDSKHGSYISYQDFYSSENIDEGFYIITSYEDMFRELNPYSSQSIIVDYEDNITKEEMERNKEILNQKYGYIEGLNMHNNTEIYDSSVNLLQIKLVPMILIFVVAMMFAGISVATTGVITVYAEQKNYGIFFVYGNSWKKTSILSVVHWGMVVLIALIIAVCVCIIIKSYEFTDIYAIQFSGHHIWVLLLISLLLIIMGVVFPYGILKKMQPINIIRNNM